MIWPDLMMFQPQSKKTTSAMKKTILTFYFFLHNAAFLKKSSKKVSDEYLNICASPGSVIFSWKTNNVGTVFSTA